MEDQWDYYYQKEGIEEFKHSLLYTALELETTILFGQKEIARKENELTHLKDLLTKTIKERDEAQEKCQMLKLEKVIFQQQQFQLQQLLQQQKGQLDAPPPPPPPPPQLAEKLVVKKALPENGKFLQAVMEAGPLLQTLLLAGPLPQWQQPPPQLNSSEIPTVPPPRILHQDHSCVVSTDGCFSKKRVVVPCHEASDSSANTKYQKVVHQSPLTNVLCSIQR